MRDNLTTRHIAHADNTLPSFFVGKTSLAGEKKPSKIPPIAMLYLNGVLRKQVMSTMSKPELPACRPSPI